MTRASRIAAIAEREQAATSGPWIVESIDYPGDVSLSVAERSLRPNDADNAAFIAESRADVPWLLEQLRLAEAVIEAARATYENDDVFTYCRESPRPDECADGKRARDQAMQEALAVYDKAGGE